MSNSATSGWWRWISAITAATLVVGLNVTAGDWARTARTNLPNTDMANLLAPANVGRQMAAAGAAAGVGTTANTADSFGPVVSQANAFARVNSFAEAAALVPAPDKSKIRFQVENEILPKALVGEQRYTPDGALQANRPGELVNAMPATLANFEGGFSAQNIPILGGQVYPPDTNGDIGYDAVTGKRYYFQWINSFYRAWDVSNPVSPIEVISATAGNALWQTLPGTPRCKLDNDGDPVVLFDEQAGRWLITQFAINSGGAGPYSQCLAVSQTGDPTGAWFVYDFTYGAKLNDYPKFGVWPDPTYNAYYMTVNQFTPPSFTWGGAGVVAYNRAKILAGDSSAEQIKFDLFTVNSDFGGMLPADLDGVMPPAGTPGIFVEVDDNTFGFPTDQIAIWEFRPNWTNPALSTFGLSGQPNYTLTVAAFNLLPCTTGGSRACIPQQSSTVKLDAIGDRAMHRAAFRNFGSHQSLVFNHTVWADATDRAGVRWYELRRDPGTGTWAIHQQSTYAPADGLYRWMGSASMDVVGNTALLFSASSAAQNPSINYAGRLAGDPLNTMAQGEAVLVAGNGAQTGTGNRWGDYSMIGTDPQDQCTFWMTSEYYTTTSSVGWATRIGSFRFPNCALGDMGILNGTITDAVTSNPIAGAQVSAQLSPSQTFSLLTNPSGVYSQSVFAGTYTVTASAYGYFPETVTGVAVISGALTTQDFDLDPAGLHVISGFVTSNPSGTPVWANVSIVGASFNPPSNTTQTNPTTGFYSLTVAGGQAYTMTVSHYLHATEVRGLAAPTTNQTENFVLSSTVSTGSVTGFVRNFYTNDPVANASVTNGTVTATTNSNGAFTLNGLAPATYVFTASANLYSPVTASVDIPTGNAAYQEFYLPTSQLSLNPASLAQTLTLGQQVTNTGQLSVSNTGLGALTFEIRENAQTGFIPAAPTANQVLVVNRFAVAAATAFTNALTALGITFDSVANTTFEGYSVPTLLAYDMVVYLGNTGTSNTSPSNLKLQAYLDAGGKLLIMDNDLGFFNNAFTLYTAYLNATFGGDDPGVGNRNLTGEDIMAGINPTSTDTFPDFYTGGVTSTVIFRYVNSTVGGTRITGSNYKAIYIATDFNNLASSSHQPLVAAAYNWLVGSGATDAIPWISESPTTGSVAASGTQAVDIGWDASAVSQPGTYTGTLTIKNNDPANQDKPVPVTLTVLPPATFGQVTGVVSTSGVCDVNYAPVVGAAILITGTNGFTASLSSGTGGVYSYWLDQAGNPYTLTVTAPNHSVGTATFSVSNGSPITENFTLRLQASCLALSPTALAANATLGDATSQPLTVDSTGALPLNYTVYEGFPPYTFFNTAFNFTDISGTGTPLNLADDGEANITAPFAFPFFGASSTNLRVGNNGAILFNATSGDIAFDNVAMSSAPNNFIAAFWDDIDDETGNVYWQSFTDRVIVQWHNRPHYDNIGAATFQAILHQSGLICFNYLDTDFGNPALNAGASATVGVRGASAAQAVQYAFNQAIIPNNTSVCIAPSVDVPWLATSITSTTGLVGPESITVTFDAAQVPAVGVYTSQLFFQNNSPEPAKVVPVVFTVTAPATFGVLDGTVTGLAACDVNPMPLEAAQVVIDGNSSVVTVTTNASGYFSRDVFGGTGTPYTVTVSKAGYLTQTFNVTVTQQTTTTQDATLRLNAPCLGSTPASLSSNQSPNTVFTQTFNLNNTGAGTLTWNILERAPALVAPIGTPTGGPTTKQAGLRLASAPAQPAAALANVVQDGSFEAAVSGDSPFWTEDSVAFGSPLCTTTSCGNGGGTVGPRTGSWWAWFGGSPTGDTGSLSQNVVITSGSNATLNFYLWVGLVGGSSDFVRVRLGTTEIYRITPTVTTAGYQLVSLNVSAFADGVSRALIFDYSFAANGNVSVDDVTLEATPSGPTCQPNSLTWVSASPVSGTLAGDSTAPINVTFDSTGLMSGVYTGTLCLNTNAQPMVEIPVTLTVTNDFGVQVTPVNGTAQAANPGQTVTYTLLVTNTGQYTDTYAMTATAGAFATFSPNALAPIGPGLSTLVNVTVTVPLTAAAGQFDVADVECRSDGDPAQFDQLSLTTTANQVAGVNVSASAAQTGTQGTTVHYTLLVTNTGNGTDTFTVTVSGNAFTTTAPASTGPLAAGASTTITASVTIPANAPGGTVDTATLTFTSQFNPASTTTRTLTTTAAMRLVYLPLIRR